MKSTRKTNSSKTPKTSKTPPWSSSSWIRQADDGFQISLCLVRVHFFLLGVPTGVRAIEKEIRLTCGEEQFRIGAGVEFLKDKSGTLTTEEAALDDSDWQILKNPNLAYSDSAFWIRFTMENSAHHWEDLLIIGKSKLVKKMLKCFSGTLWFVHGLI